MNNQDKKNTILKMYILKSAISSRDDISVEFGLFDTFIEALYEARSQIIEPDYLSDLIQEWIDEANDGNEPDYDVIENEANIPEFVIGELREYFIKLQFYVNNIHGYSEPHFSFEIPDLSDPLNSDTGHNYFIYKSVSSDESRIVEIATTNLPPQEEKNIQNLKEDNERLRDLLKHKWYKPGNVGEKQAMEEFRTLRII